MITITRATDRDCERLAPLFVAYRVFYDVPAQEAESLAFLRERLANDESVVFFAICEDRPDAIAGFTQLFRSFSSVSLCRSWILNDLFVHPDFRGRGVGRKLMERAAEHARDTGAGQLWLQTDIDNETAQKLYDAVGMTKKRILEYTLRP